MENQLFIQPPNVDYSQLYQKSPHFTQASLDWDSKADDKSNIKSKDFEQSE